MITLNGLTKMEANLERSPEPPITRRTTETLTSRFLSLLFFFSPLEWIKFFFWIIFKLMWCRSLCQCPHICTRWWFFSTQFCPRAKGKEETFFCKSKSTSDEYVPLPQHVEFSLLPVTDGRLRYRPVLQPRSPGTWFYGWSILLRHRSHLSHWNRICRPIVLKAPIDFSLESSIWIWEWG